MIRVQDITPEFLGSLKYLEITQEELDEILALAQTRYSPAELQIHLERDDGISADDVLLEMEQVSGTVA